MDLSEGNNAKNDDKPVCNEHLRKLMDLHYVDPENVGNPMMELFMGLNVPKKKPRILTNLMEISAHFENFHYWELLPVEIRCLIVKETDFITRFALICTSKSNYEIAHSVPVLLKSIEVNTMYQNDRIYVTIFPKTGRKEDRVRLCYSKIDFREGQGKVTRHWNKYGSGEVEEEYYFDEDFDLMEEMGRFIENLLKLANYQVDEFKAVLLGMRDYGKDSIFLNKLQVRKKLINTNSYDEETFMRWLNTVKAPLDQLFLNVSKKIHSEFYMDHETIKNAKDLGLMHSSVRDADLFRLTAEKIDIISDNGITNKGINKFIKRWIDGEGPENFRSAHINRRKVDSSVIRNIKYHKWDDDFEKENPILAEWIKSKRFSGECYYIESKNGNNGATLVVESDGITFMVTGKRS